MMPLTDKKTLTLKKSRNLLRILVSDSVLIVPSYFTIFRRR